MIDNSIGWTLAYANYAYPIYRGKDTSPVEWVSLTSLDTGFPRSPWEAQKIALSPLPGGLINGSPTLVFVIVVDPDEVRIGCVAAAPIEDRGVPAGGVACGLDHIIGYPPV